MFRQPEQSELRGLRLLRWFFRPWTIDVPLRRVLDAFDQLEKAEIEASASYPCDCPNVPREVGDVRTPYQTATVFIDENLLRPEGERFLYHALVNGVTSICEHVKSVFASFVLDQRVAVQFKDDSSVIAVPVFSCGHCSTTAPTITRKSPQNPPAQAHKTIS
jgi:hypothetical protein